jgi:PAS domain S-box-containing protein
MRVTAWVSLLVAVTALAVAVTVATSIRGDSTDLSDRLVPAASDLGALSDAYTAQSTALRDYVGSGQQAALAPYRTAETEIPPLVDKLEAGIRDHPGLSRMLQTATSAHRQWLNEVAEPEIAAMTTGDLAGARAIQAAQSSATHPVALAQRLAVANLQTGITGEMATTARNLRGLQNYLLGALIATFVLLVVVVIGGLVAVRRWLLKPFAQLRAAADAVAAGDHDVVVPAVGPSELADMGRSMETMRTRLLDALSEREAVEQRFRGLLEASPDATVGVGVDGQIRMVNAQAERMFGYPADELIGQLVDLLVPEATRDGHPAHRSGYFADPRPRPMGQGQPLTARRRDGREFPVEISLSSFGTGPDLIVSAAVRDVTERLAMQAEREQLLAEAEHERYESRLAQSQRLETLGHLVGGVAHDFNNLLNVIVGYSGFVTQELRDVADTEPRWASVLADMAQVEGAATRAGRLTHQLLAFARREVVRPEVVNMNEVVIGVEQLLRRTLGEHIDLVTSLNLDLWPVMIDPGQLEQVFVNLAVNSRDAMPAGGKLSVDTDNVEVDAVYATARPGLEAGSYARLRVSDSGAGMDRQVVQRAFEPFFTTKPQGQGTGLGLATVYGIVIQAGGHVQIYSEPGLGTTITALLPVTDETARASQPAAPTTDSAGLGETVLVVEDEESLRDMVVRILDRSGYRVLTVPTVVEALQEASALDQRIDLLLTDLVMPTMLGSELAQRVRELRPDIRVLFMSGYAQPVLGEQIALDGGIDLLEKPFTADALLTRVRGTLDR